MKNTLILKIKSNSELTKAFHLYIPLYIRQFNNTLTFFQLFLGKHTNYRNFSKSSSKPKHTKRIAKLTGLSHVPEN